MPAVLVILTIVIIIVLYFVFTNKFQCPRCQNIQSPDMFRISTRTQQISLGKDHKRNVQIHLLKCRQCEFTWEMAYNISLRRGTPKYICDGCGGIHENYIRMSTACWWEVEDEKNSKEGQES